MKLLQIFFDGMEFWSTAFHIIIGIIGVIGAVELIAMLVRYKDIQTRDRRAIRRGDLHD